MDPTGPSQPTLNQAYNTAGNPADQTPQEASSATRNAQSNAGSIVDRREQGDLPVPSTHGQEATPSSLGYGARDASGDAGERVGEAASNLEGEQMRAAGDGDIARAQDTKTGFGEQEDLAAGLEEKKKEQAGEREAIKEQRRENVDIGGALGGRGGAAVVEGHG